MQPLAIAAILLTGALDWAAYSPLDVPLEIERRETSEPVARVYAARGEYEGIHLTVTAGRKAAANVLLTAEAPGRDLPAPVVFQMLPISGADIKTECLDALVPAHPLALVPGATAHYWIRYAIPTGAKPGVRQTELRLSADGERALKIPVRLEIFELELPERPSLPSVFFLNRTALRGAFSLTEPALDAWKPHYLALGGYRLGFSLWDGSGLTRGDDATALREHLGFAADALGPAALDLAGGNGAGWRGAAKPGAGQSLDPLNLMLNGIANTPALAGTPLTAAFDYFPPRANWLQPIEVMQRLATGSRLLRVAAAPLHPAFQPLLDAWAIPFRACNPALITRLRSGDGIAGPRAFPEARFSASASDVNDSNVPYDSEPVDAADGSLFTAWLPGKTGPKDNAPWWQADFEAPTHLEEITLAWLTGHETQQVELWTTLDGKNYARANVKWERRPAPTPLDLPATQGTLRFPGKVLGIRLLLHRSEGEPQPALAEVRLAGEPFEAADLAEHSIKPWLALEFDSFPTTMPGRPIAEPRVIGWACWFGGLEGLLGLSLNNWPGPLLQRATDAPIDLPSNSGDFLFYPVDGQLVPSMRAERLRDGLEDYEYLRLLSQARERGDKLPQGADELLQPLRLPAEPTPEELSAWATHILETRVKIGRALE